MFHLIAVISFSIELALEFALTFNKFFQLILKGNLLYRHECFTGKYTTRRIHTKPHPGLEWRIFHILTSEDIDDFTDIKFVS